MPEATYGWGRGELLVALWLLLPILGLVLWSLRSRARALVKLALAGIEVAGPSRRVHRTRLVLTVTGLAFALVALAQPRWGYRWQDLPQEGRAIAVLLDVSLSMDAQDVSPSRMERARRELLDLADELRGDKIGLVQFAGGAYPRMPLTLDVDAFRRIVRDSSTSTLRAQGSDLGRGIEVAMELLDGVPAGDRAIIILSDGEDQVGQALAAAQAAADKGIHIYTLGIGTTEGAPIPLADGGFKKDKAGAVVLTRLDRDLLQQVAAAGAGAYADSVAGTQDIRAIYRDEILGGLEAAELGVRREKVWTERYQWPLGLGFVLLLLASALRPPRARRVASTTAGRAAAMLPLLLLPALLGPAPANAGDAAAAPEATTTDPELQRLLAEQAQRPGDLAVAERVGRALFEAGRYDQAHEVLTGVAQRSLDPEQRQRARTNAGLAAYRAGRLVDAVSEWQQVLGENAEHEAAARNAQAVQEEIQRRLQQQPPEQQPQQGDQGEEGEPQDGEQQDGEQPPPQGDTGAPPQEGEQDQPQDGEPQDGEPQDGQQDQPQQDQPQDGDQQAPPEGDGTREPTEAPPPPDGEQPDEGGETFQAQGADTGEPGEEADGAVHRPGSMSEQEADRLLDGVEEGSPRVVVDPGSRGGEDW